MVEVKKRDKETSEALIRRFSKQMQSSGVLPRARKSRFRVKAKSKRKLREDAVYREKVRKAVDKLKKLGKFDEEKLKDIKKKVSEQ